MKKLNMVCVLGALVMLNGCAARYSCVGKEGTGGCMSVSTVAKRTTNDLPEGKVEEQSALKSRKDALKLSAQRAHLINAAPSALAQVNVGDPILTTPKTMRMLFAPFKDDQGDLNTGGYVYMQVTPSEWVLAK